MGTAQHGAREQSNLITAVITANLLANLSRFFFRSSIKRGCKVSFGFWFSTRYKGSTVLESGSNRMSKSIIILWLVALAGCRTSGSMDVADVAAEEQGSGLFKIEGKLVTPEPKPVDWHWNTRIMIDGGRRSAFIKEDHTFVA